MDELQTIASGTSLPVAVGSGVTPDNVGDIFTVADAVIVASWLKHDGVWWNPVDPETAAHVHAGSQKSAKLTPWGAFLYSAMPGSI